MSVLWPEPRCVISVPGARLLTVRYLAFAYSQPAKSGAIPVESTCLRANPNRRSGNERLYTLVREQACRPKSRRQCVKELLSCRESPAREAMLRSLVHSHCIPLRS